MSNELTAVIDSVLATSNHASPKGMVPEVLARLTPEEREAALKESLRAYIELRIHETQDEPGLVRTDETEKVRENRLRRAAARQGLILVKSRRRDPRATDYGLYVLVDDTAGNRIGHLGGEAATSAFANGEGVALDQIEKELNR